MWNIIQHFQIANAREEARKAAGAASRRAESQATRIEEAEDKIERLTLACQAMWELLRDQHGLTEGKLAAKMEEIDARDGKIDGKITEAIVTCLHCGVATPTTARQCRGCGKEVSLSHSFKS